MLINNKEKVDGLQKSGVYQLTCNDCDAIYIGQTDCALKKRLGQHLASVRNSKSTTGFSDHCISNKHAIDLNNYKLLHQVAKSKRLNYLEMIEITKASQKGKFLTNDMTHFNLSPLLKLASKF